MTQAYDALLVISFGGPEGRDDVIPFLDNILRGRNVPRERMLEVAEHYYQFDGISPINGQVRALIQALTTELAEHHIDLPIYWGNRNWHPLIGDTLRQMQADGIQRALALATSAFSCYSGCRQYREDIFKAQQALDGPRPDIDKIRVFFDHPGYIETMALRTQAALEQIPSDRHATTHLVFTAHSIPQAMAAGCHYEAQLDEASRLVANALRMDWTLVYQSRSGPPTQPWLEPDVCDYLPQLANTGNVTDVVIVPIGFLSDHMEVLFDLDTEARDLCGQLGLGMVRAPTAGTHPRFIAMIRELIEERTAAAPPRALGSGQAAVGLCEAECCWSGRPGFVPHEQTENSNP